MVIEKYEKRNTKMNNEQFVYVVISGQFSGNSIEKIFYTEETAEDYAQELKKVYVKVLVEKYTIETEDNILICHKGLGSTINISTGNITHWDENYKKPSYPNIKFDPPEMCTNNGIPFAIAVVSFISQDHADKLAVEARQKYLRENEEKNDTPKH